MKSWVSSAFGSDDPVKQSSQTKTAKRSANTQSSVKSSQISSLENKVGSKILPDKNKENHLIEDVRIPTKRLPITSINNSNDNPADVVSLFERYEPTKRADLVVNKAKIDQLSKILDDLSSPRAKKASILIIEGPSGSGKLSTLKVLCQEKSIELVTWTNNNFNNLKIDNLMANTEMSDTNNNENNFTHYESQIKQLQQYLFKSSRYVTNQIFNEQSNTDSRTASINKRVLFIKEVPSFVYFDINKFLNLLKDFLKFSKSSLIFSLTNTSSSNHSSISKDSNNYYKIFTANIRKELNILEINFNAFASSYMTKHLERICKLESYAFADKNFISNLVACSNGDLRHALNQLELISVQFRHKGNVSHIAKNERTTINKRSMQITNDSKIKSNTSTFENCSKDSSYGIFRGLGKILYRKNLEFSSKDPEIVQRFKSEQRGLPSHLINGYLRDPLSFEPEETLSKIPMSNESIMLYLHQNYLELFAIRSNNSNKSFDDKFNALISIYDGFIGSDQINAASFNNQLSNSTHENKLKELATLISMRSILFNLNFNTANQDEPQPKSSGKSIWMPLFKPYLHKMIEMKNKRTKVARQIIVNDFDSRFELNREFFTSILPFVIAKNRILSTKGRLSYKITNESTRVENVLLFSKFNPTNSKRSTDQISESSADVDDDFEESMNEAKSKKQPKLDDDDKQIIKSTLNYEYENAGSISIVDAKF